MLKSTLTLFVLFICSVDISKAFRCWKCDNALTFEDCTNRGQSVECDGENGGCFTEIRFNVGLIPPIRLTTRCKQGNECSKNEYRNVKDCKSRNPICRCCCVGEDCNKPELRIAK
ncbi:ly6/PLAUR domain-containing protein 6B-like [Styela clava]